MDWDDVIGRVNVVFSLAGGDIAVNTLHVACVDGSTGELGLMDTADLGTVLTTIRTEYEDFYNANSGFYSGCKVDHLDGYNLAAAAPHNALNKVSLGGTNKPGGTSQSLPPEVAAVVSLYGYPNNTFVPLARRRRGRFYLPGLTTSYLTSEGLLSGTATGALATFGQSLAEALWDTELSSDQRAQLVVASRTGNALWPVEQIRVDNHPDVQRRRQFQMPTVVTRLPVTYD